MLKIQILAAEVSNLTDARYFAAWGVDYVSFNCNQGEDNFIEENKLIEIKDWIEGPKFLANFIGLDEAPFMEELVDRLGLEGLVLGPFTPEATINAIDAEIIFQEYIEKDALELMDQFQSKSAIHQSVIPIVKTTLAKASDFFSKEVFLDIEDLNIEMVSRIINESQCGIVLRGGDEEKVGLKSFDFLDEVFELLMN